MLKMDHGRMVDRADLVPGPLLQSSGYQGLRAIGWGLRKNLKETAAIVLGFLLLGVLFIATSTPLFTATSRILIDARRTNAGESGSANRSLAELGMDPASIDSQVAVLGSERIAIDVLKRLHLEKADEFAEPTTLPGWIAAGFRGAFGRESATTADQDGIRSDILEGFMKRLDVKRLQQTNVLTVEFSAPSATQAAAIVNAFAAVYVSEQIRSQFESRTLATTWLKGRIREVREEIGAAEQAVRSLKVESGVGMQGTPAAGSPPAATASVPYDTRMKLSNLETDLENKRTSYEALVSRANAGFQQQSLPVSSASILSEARPPKKKAQPNTPLILALSVMAGLAAAGGYRAYRDLVDRSFRVPSRVESELQVKFIGLLPKIVPSTPDSPVDLSPRGASAHPDKPAIFDHTAANRSARYAETLRAAKVAAEISTHHDGATIIGIVSALAGEGRSTVAANLTALIADEGRSVALVDADFRHATLSDALTPPQRRDDAGGGVPKPGAIVRNVLLGADFFPATERSTSTPAAAARELGDLQAFLSGAADSYDYVVLDLPPLSFVSDIAALTPRIGTFLLVIAWGETDRAVVGEALRSVPLVADRLAGAVLNKVDVAALDRMTRDPRDAFHVVDCRRETGARDRTVDV